MSIQPPQSPSPPPVDPPPDPSPSGLDEYTSNDRILAALGYIFWFVALIVLLLEETKRKPLLRDHAVQALGFLVASLIYYAIATIIFICGTIITLGFGAIILWVIFLPPFFLSLLFAWMAYDRQDALFEIPVLTDLIRDQGMFDTLPPRNRGI